MKLKSLTNKDRYGNMFSVEFFEPQTSVPMMMIIPEMEEGYNGATVEGHPGNPKGTDTVPAWLTPGENVVNAEASRIPGNQEMIDQMNEEGRMIQKAQGGPIPTYQMHGGMIPPMYAKEGRKIPSWLTDNVLDSLMMTESSGDPSATSEAGAQGLYQIMPSTAADPGMGVTPLAPEDIRDPDKSRAFAKDYLAAIQEYYPSFSRDDVLTAYHSGAGNVLKAKAGEEALGPRGQAYAGKVMAGVEEPSVLDKVASLAGDALSAINPISTAQAQTSVPPAQTEEPPKDDEPFSIFGFEPFTPSSAVVARNNEFNRKAAKANAEPVGESFKEMEIKRLNNLKEGRDEFAGINKNTYLGLKDAVEFQKENVIQETKESLITNAVDPGLAKAAFDATKLETQELGVPTPEEIAVSNTPEYKDHVKRAAEAGVKPKSPDEFAKHFTVDESGSSPASREAPFSDTTATEEAISKAVVKSPDDFNKKSAEKIIEETEDTGPQVDVMTPEGEAEINAILQQAKDENPTFVESLIQGFKDTFSNMFDPNELSRMAMMYAGSRILGYDHGGSLNFAAKNYIKRVDAAAADRKDFVTDKDNLEDYTAKSLKEYQQTGDISVLKPKVTSTGPVIKEVSGSVYLVGEGRVNTYKDDNGIEYIKGQAGYIPVSSIGDYIEPYDSSVHSDTAIQNSFTNDFESVIKAVNANIDDENLQVKGLDNRELARQATTEYRKFLRRNGVSVNQAIETKGQITAAMNKFAQDTATAKRNGTPVPTSLRAYINEQIMIPLTGVQPGLLSGVSTQSIDRLDDKIRGTIEKSPRDSGYQDDYQENWLLAQEAFFTVPKDKDEANQLAKDLGIKKIVPRNDWASRSDNNENETAFSLWLANTSIEDMVKLINYAEGQ